MRYWVLFILTFVSGIVFGQAHKQFKIRITPLGNNFYVCTSYGLPDEKTPFPANGLFAVTAKSVVLINSPWDEDQTRQLIDSVKRRFNKPIKLCIATHFHDDCVGGLDVLRHKGTKTYSSKLTDELAAKNGNKRAQFTFVHDTTFVINGLKLQTYYPGAGHTRDNIVVWFPKQKILFGGCFIKSLETNSIGNIADADIKQWPASLKNLTAHFANARVVIPGHQSWAGGTKQFNHTLQIINATR
jgi:metallo-beta-lactamase class B